jgi:hypothetical protein
VRQIRGKAAWVAVAATFMTLAGPVAAAHADFGDIIQGGCGVVTGPLITSTGFTVTVDGNAGVIYDLSVSKEQNGGPSDATVSCWIDVNGNEAPGTRLTVSDSAVRGVEAGEQQISFGAGSSDVVTECQQVAFADGSTWVAPDGNIGTDCRPVTRQEVNASQVAGLFDVIKQQHVDPVVCPVLVALGQATGGRVLGVVTIEPDGDVFVAQLTGPDDDWVYDCAPYGDHFGDSPLVSNPLAGGDSLINLLLPPLL